MTKTNYQNSKKRVIIFSMMIFWLMPFRSFSQNSNCIDLRDLNASNIHCTYGTFGNPFCNNGVMNGRHTVITQPGIDPRTNGGLNMIPLGETYSIKLGNECIGAEAESISCDIIVDTNDFDLLILKYAAVMENPNHSPSGQPKFRFDILNVQNEAIDPNCLSAEFVANASLGWHTNGLILWKDWTNVGVDVSDYHGETIRVRLTTYDCAHGGHFGYAYFVLSCGNKSMEVCGDTEEYTYWAPDGFTYEWHWMDDISHTISTNQAVSVPVGSNRTLVCHVSFIGNPDCGFDICSHPEYMYPISGFVAQNTECPQTFDFINMSGVSNDGIHPNGSGNLCENVFWDFGDGQSSYDTSPTHTYDLPGDYTVMMISGIHGFDCADTSYHIVTVPPNTLIDTLSCETFFWNGNTYTESGTYSHVFSSSHGCDSLVTMNVTIKKGVTNYIEDMGCDEYVWNNVKYDVSGLYEQILPNQFGCDSIVTLDLDMGYTPRFQIVGNDAPIAGTEEAYTLYPYNIELLNPLSSLDSVCWTLGDHNGFDLQPVGNGSSANLYLYAYALDSIEITAKVYNRCGVEEHSFWFHTSYYGVAENEKPSLFNIFPNPNNGEFKLRLHNVDGEVDIIIFNYMGVAIMEKEIKSEPTTKYFDIDLKGYPNGVYIVEVNYEGKSYKEKCLLIQ